MNTKVQEINRSKRPLPYLFFLHNRAISIMIKICHRDCQRPVAVIHGHDWCDETQPITNTNEHTITSRERMQRKRLFAESTSISRAIESYLTLLHITCLPRRSTSLL